MILPLFRRAQQVDSISTLYGTIVAQARLPSFYRDFGVPDTVDGRFDLLVLHLALFLRRIDGEGDAFRGLGQKVFDLFCRDMDQNLREMGVSDLKVPDEMRRIGAAYYGRARAYNEALMQSKDDLLVETVARNLYGTAAAAEVKGEKVAAYMRRAAVDLAVLDIAAIARGELRFPEP